MLNGIPVAAGWCGCQFLDICIDMTGQARWTGVTCLCPPSHWLLHATKTHEFGWKDDLIGLWRQSLIKGPGMSSLSLRCQELLLHSSEKKRLGIGQRSSVWKNEIVKRGENSRNSKQREKTHTAWTCTLTHTVTNCIMFSRGRFTVYNEI